MFFRQREYYFKFVDTKFFLLPIVLTQYRNLHECTSIQRYSAILHMFNKSKFICDGLFPSCIYRAAASQCYPTLVLHWFSSCYPGASQCKTVVNSYSGVSSAKRMTLDQHTSAGSNPLIASGSEFHANQSECWERVVGRHFRGNESMFLSWDLFCHIISFLPDPVEIHVASQGSLGCHLPYTGLPGPSPASGALSSLPG